jgi:hypothetical protein
MAHAFPGTRFDVTSRSRFTVTIFGLVCVLGGIVSLLNGSDKTAEIGFVLGAGMIVGNEWWVWRSRS